MGYLILTEYERGTAQLAIEWVARSQKPIVEIGGRPVDGCDMRDLARDLNRCILQSRETVRAFIIPDKISGYCSYGFYRYPWAIKALLCLLAGNKTGLTRSDLLWMQGLVFGYSPDAIQRFMCASRVRASSSRHSHLKIRRVEIYGPLVSLVRGRSKWICKYQKHD